MSLLSTLAMRCAIRQSSSQVERGAALEAECGIGTGGAGGLSKRSRATAPTAQIVKKIRLRAIGPRFLMRVSSSFHWAAPEDSVQYGATESCGVSPLGYANPVPQGFDWRAATRQRVPVTALRLTARAQTRCRSGFVVGTTASVVGTQPQCARGAVHCAEQRSRLAEESRRRVQKECAYQKIAPAAIHRPTIVPDSGLLAVA